MSSKDWVTNFVDRQLFDLRLLVLEWDCKTSVGCVGGAKSFIRSSVHVSHWYHQRIATGSKPQVEVVVRHRQVY